ncbi:hypothetical protein B0H63DRAFT_496254 [Podospora didyma]|uniref:PHD-type domain-containing protein n=1 Tax=Podospora didyma TaxID=330526 RepID=A0AAE0KFE0_9PEZI|nr:hypothetical protein B0H63DRAFT_496254 [Podospora didyma]
MSGDQPASSFGEPNAQPPTPKQTPTSSIFPSPVFETPKVGHLEESSGWTPRFAEEYSVFNATPGNLRGSNGPFTDFGPASPYFGVGQKRPLSAGGIAAEIASHVNHLSPNPNLPLPPVEPSRQLKSSPRPLATPTFDRSAVAEQVQDSPERTAKKARRGTATRDPQGQTTTPPPSARKGERILAAGSGASTMQNDQGYGQPDFMGAHQQPGMGNFVTTPTDMYGYPLSAPAAPGFGSQRSFWDADTGMGGMDMDYSGNGANAFDAQHSAHQPLGTVDWARTNQILMQSGGMVEHGQENHGVPLVSQASMQAIAASSAGLSMFTAAYVNQMGDPFGIGFDGGAVNPGLIFSRPQSSSMDTSSFSAPLPTQNSAAPPAPQETRAIGQAPIVVKAPVRNELRRSASVKDIAPNKQDRTLASSPIKSTARPGLSRSFSENRGKKAAGRASLPTLAPAPRPQQLMGNADIGANRPTVSQPNRPNGRSSPIKKSHHQRLPSLSSIPEAAAGPRARTHAKFTIDANGRARVETTIIVDDEPPPTIRKRHSAQPLSLRRQWVSSEDDDSSSTDDEPIVIPSRNTSFALPDPRKPTTVHPFHQSHRSFSERSTSSYTTFLGGSRGDVDSDTETNEATPPGRPSGDAASELRKLRESRHKQLSMSNQTKFASGGSGIYTGHNNISPTALTDASLPTPSSDVNSENLRCICNRSEVGRDFMVQCESCDLYSHGSCLNITERTMRNIFICPFCANTPNMRGGRLRDTGRFTGAVAPSGSPLGHKSFKSFR